MLRQNILYLVLLLTSSFCLAEDEQLILDEADVETGKAVIIELEPEDVSETSLEQTKKTARKNKNPKIRQIELIVGGQGEDGIAKRGNLIINDK